MSVETVPNIGFPPNNILPIDVAPGAAAPEAAAPEAPAPIVRPRGVNKSYPGFAGPAAYLADRVVLLKNAKIHKQGTSAEIKVSVSDINIALYGEIRVPRTLSFSFVFVYVACVT